MATSENNDIKVRNDRRDPISRYSKDIDEDITPVRKLLEEYSKIPLKQVIAHIHAVVRLPAMFLTFSLLPLTLPSESSTLLRLLPLLIMIIHALLLLAPHQRDQA